MDNFESCILVVEDDIALLESISDMFKGEFDHVVSACDGVSAYLAISERNPDIIFSDIRMPGFDGLELVTRLRAEGNSTPVLLASGTAEKAQVLKALRLGVIDLLEKPYTLEQVKTAVYRVIEISARESELQKTIAEFGEESPQVKRQRRMIGLFKAVNASKPIFG